MLPSREQLQVVQGKRTLYAGFVWKVSRNNVWQKRYMYLTNSELIYSKSSPGLSSRSKRIVPLAAIQEVKPERPANQRIKNCFSVKTSSRVYYFYTERDYELQMWLSSLLGAIKSSPPSTPLTGSVRSLASVAGLAAAGGSQLVAPRALISTPPRAPTGGSLSYLSTAMSTPASKMPRAPRLAAEPDAMSAAPVSPLTRRRTTSVYGLTVRDVQELEEAIELSRSSSSNLKRSVTSVFRPPSLVDASDDDLRMRSASGYVARSNSGTDPSLSSSSSLILPTVMSMPSLVNRSSDGSGIDASLSFADIALPPQMSTDVLFMPVEPAGSSSFLAPLPAASRPTATAVNVAAAKKSGLSASAPSLVHAGVREMIDEGLAPPSYTPAPPSGLTYRGRTMRRAQDDGRDSVDAAPAAASSSPCPPLRILTQVPGSPQVPGKSSSLRVTRSSAAAGGTPQSDDRGSQVDTGSALDTAATPAPVWLLMDGISPAAHAHSRSSSLATGTPVSASSTLDALGQLEQLMQRVSREDRATLLRRPQTPAAPRASAPSIRIEADPRAGQAAAATAEKPPSPRSLLEPSSPREGSALSRSQSRRVLSEAAVPSPDEASAAKDAAQMRRRFRSVRSIHVLAPPVDGSEQASRREPEGDEATGSGEGSSRTAVDGSRRAKKKRTMEEMSELIDNRNPAKNLDVVYMPSLEEATWVCKMDKRAIAAVEEASFLSSPGEGGVTVASLDMLMALGNRRLQFLRSCGFIVETLSTLDYISNDKAGFHSCVVEVARTTVAIYAEVGARIAAINDIAARQYLRVVYNRFSEALHSLVVVGQTFLQQTNADPAGALREFSAIQRLSRDLILWVQALQVAF